MKNIKSSVHVVAGTLLVCILSMLTSCQIQNRRYRPGISVQWKGSDKEVSNNIEEKEIKVGEQASSVSSMSSYCLEPPAEISQQFATEKPTIQRNSKQDSRKKISISKGIVEHTTHGAALEKIFQQSSENTSSLESSNLATGDPTKQIIGWIAILLGLIILFFASILLGAIFIIVGVVLAISGANKRDYPKQERSRNDERRKKIIEEEEEEDSNELQEVVYLKNGGIVRGVIIEQIPNAQLKIQTRDGNVFVFQMNEIERITKEYRNK
jgi:hypothetical protein